MQSIIKYSIIVLLGLCVFSLKAQDTIPDPKILNKIEILEKEKEKIKNEEKAYLKNEVEAINKKLSEGIITKEEAATLKKEMATKRALNIENRVAIVENKIALLKRNNEDSIDPDDGGYTVEIQIGKKERTYSNIKSKDKDKPQKYDRRTTSDLVFALGFNNAIVENTDFGKSPYSFGRSRFYELGYAWKTRLLQNSNAIRFKYGLSFQLNFLNIKDNQYFVQKGNITSLEEFPSQLKKAKFRTVNLVFPLHFEFGPSKKIDKKTYFRYSTKDQFKIGLGGYAGFNIGTRQKLKYERDGNKVREKIRNDYNTNDLVYGLSSYISFGSTGLYIKYDLSTIFSDQAIDQNNISLGVRFDMD